MRNKGWLLKAANSPVESLIFIFGAGLFAFGVYVLGPWFAVTSTSPIAQAIPQEPGQWAFGFILLLGSIPSMIAPFTKRWKLAGTASFLIYLFLCILRVLVEGWFPLQWVYPLMISLACGMLRLYVGVRRE